MRKFTIFSLIYLSVALVLSVTFKEKDDTLHKDEATKVIDINLNSFDFDAKKYVPVEIDTGLRLAMTKPLTIERELPIESPNPQQTEENGDASMERSTQVIESPVVTYNNLLNVSYEGNISADTQNAVNAMLSRIPSPLVDKFNSTGHRILVSSNDVASTYLGLPYNSVAGYYIPSDKIIYFTSNTSYIYSGLLHEVGHFVDFYGGAEVASSASEFNEIFNSECANLSISAHRQNHMSCPEEYFAEVFNQIVNNPGVVQRDTPRSYEYVMRYIN